MRGAVCLVKPNPLTLVQHPPLSSACARSSLSPSIPTPPTLAETVGVRHAALLGAVESVVYCCLPHPPHRLSAAYRVRTCHACTTTLACPPASACACWCATFKVGRAQRGGSVCRHPRKTHEHARTYTMTDATGRTATRHRHRRHSQNNNAPWKKGSSQASTLHTHSRRPQP